MELKVWVDGFQRLVCGISQQTTCQEVIYALAHATGKTGRFVLVEKWRTSERSLSPHDKPLELLLKWGEYASDVQFVLRCLENSVQAQAQPQPQPASIFSTNSLDNTPASNVASSTSSGVYKANFINSNNNNNNAIGGGSVMNSDKTMARPALNTGSGSVVASSSGYYRTNADDENNCRTINPTVNRRITTHNVPPILPPFSSLNVHGTFDKTSPPVRNTNEGLLVHENYAVIQKPGQQQNSFSKNLSNNSTKPTNVVVLSHSAHENLATASCSSGLMNKHSQNEKDFGYSQKDLSYGQKDFNFGQKDFGHSQKDLSYSQQDSLALDSSDLSTLPSSTDSCNKKPTGANQNQTQDQNQPLTGGSAYNRKPVPPSPSITRAYKNSAASQKQISAPNQQAGGPGPGPSTSSQPIPPSVPFKGARPPPPSYEETMKQRRQNYAAAKSPMQITPPLCSSTSSAPHPQSSSFAVADEGLAFCQNKMFVDRTAQPPPQSSSMAAAAENFEWPPPSNRDQLFHLIESQQNVIETQVNKIRALDNLIDMEQLKFNELKKQQYEDSGNMVAELQRLETKHAQLKQTLDEMRSNSLPNCQNLEIDLIDLRRQNAALSIESKTLENRMKNLDDELSTKEKILEKILVEYEKEDYGQKDEKDENFDDQKFNADDQNFDDDQNLLQELDKILREKKKKCDEIEAKIVKESSLKFIPGHLDDLEHRQVPENDVIIMPHMSQLIKETTPGVWV